MSTATAKLSVFASGQLACIKIVGRANFTSSIDFKTLANELLQKGYTCLILDLSECLLMDSTFLGVLAGFGLKMTVQPAQSTDGLKAARGIELLNPNPRIAELLENLGVLHLFKVVNGTLEMPKDAAHQATTPTLTPSREEVTQNCLEAHKTLMEIAPANVPRFKDVAQFLAEDLKKSKTDS